jgi:hypothetical protein
MILVDVIAEREVIEIVRLSYVFTSPWEKVAEQLEKLPI